MMDMFPKSNSLRISHNIENPNVVSFFPKNTIIQEENAIDKTKQDWKDAWMTLFDWVKFNFEVGRVFCKVYKEVGEKYAYATDGFTNIKISALQNHAKSVEHRK